MAFTGPSAKAQSTDAATEVPYKIWDINKKRCSIVLMAGVSPSLLESYLQDLAEAASPAGHELILINDKSLGIDIARLVSLVPNLRLVTQPASSNLEQMQSQAAREASGRYLLFVNRVIKLTRESLEAFLRKFEVTGTKVGVSQDKSLILVNRAFFLRFGSLSELFRKVEEQPSLSKGAGYHHNLIGNLNRYVQVRGRNVLVVGCAQGLECELYRRRGAKEVFGLDITDKIGKYYQHPAIKYVKASAMEMPFDDNTFDICSSIATLEHIPDPKTTVEEMVRVTRRDGIIFCFAAPLWHSRHGHHKEDIFPNEPWIHLRKKSAEQMKAYYGEACNEVFGGDTIAGHIDWIYGSNYCNRIGVRKYKSIAAEILSTINPIYINFNLNLSNQDLLTPEIRSELEGYTREELFTEALFWVLRKV